MRKPLTIALLMALLGLSSLYSQQRSITDYLAECERKYGSDANLVNGEKYFYPYGLANGTPFFFSESRSARISIQGKEFEAAQLRYDIFNQKLVLDFQNIYGGTSSLVLRNQKLVLDFQNIYGGTSSLVLRNEWVESFAFDNQKFIKMKGPDGQTGYFQLVTDGSIACVYKWSKKYLLNLTSGEQNYYFTEPSKESFLLMGGQFHSYRSNNSFLKVFEAENQKLVKQFMRQSKVKVNNATDSQIRHLVEYCNSLYHEDS